MPMDAQSFGPFIKMLGALSLILGILLAINYGVRCWGRFFGAGREHDSDIMVLALKEIIPKKYVVLVRVSERELILGVSDAGINLLGEVERNAEKLAQRQNNGKGGEAIP